MENVVRFPAFLIGGVYFAASIVLLVLAGGIGWGANEILFTVFVLFWMNAPITLGAKFGLTLKSEGVGLFFYTGVIGVAIWGYHALWQVFFVLPPDAQGAIALFIGPVYQWVGICICIGVARVLDRHVAKP